MAPKATARDRSASKARRQAARTPPAGWNDPLAQQQPLVSGRWLLRALLLVLAFAVLSAYLTLCLLFYQGQWQVVFHPVRTIDATPATLGFQYDDVRFDYTQTGVAQLAGWWIPAAPQAANVTRTILFFHDGQGSLSSTLSQLEDLHSLGVNVFAFDYRGFGNSVSDHPSEERVYQDADAAWEYLAGIRHLHPESIVLYGTGIGATIAAEAAIRHPQSGAVVLEDPAPPALRRVESDLRTHLLPIQWLFHDRFETAPRLQQLGIPLAPALKQSLDNGKPVDAPITLHQKTSNGRTLLLCFASSSSPASECYSELGKFWFSRVELTCQLAPLGKSCL